MEDQKNVVLHKQRAPKLYLIGKISLSYLGLFLLWAFVVHIYSTFGTGWIQLAVALMWIGGAVGVFFIPETKEQTIKETKWAVIGYLMFLLIYRVVIVKFSQFSPTQVGVSLGVNMPVASATAALGFAQNILMIVSILTPVGFLVWISQKFKTHQGRKAKDETFWKYKSIRDTGRR